MNHGLEYPKCGSLDCYECRQRSEAILATYGVSLKDFDYPEFRLNHAVDNSVGGHGSEKADNAGTDPNLRLCPTCGRQLPHLNRRRKFCNATCRENATLQKRRWSR